MINLAVGLICKGHKPLEGNYCYFLKEFCYRLSGNTDRSKCIYMCEEEHELMQTYFSKEEVLVFSKLKCNDNNSGKTVINFNDHVTWNISGDSYEEIIKLVQGLNRITSFNIADVEFVIRSIELSRGYSEAKSKEKVFSA